MKGLPNMKVFCPSDDTQTKWVVNKCAEISGPCYIRTARLSSPVIYENDDKFEVGKGAQIGEGTDATLFATGICVSEALKAQEELKKENIDVRVVDMFCLKPIDKEIIIKSAKETKHLISIEDHSVIGGLGSIIADVLTEEFPTKLIKIGVNDRFGESGKATELLKKFELDSESIANKVKSIME